MYSVYMNYVFVLLNMYLSKHCMLFTCGGNKEYYYYVSFIVVYYFPKGKELLLSDQHFLLQNFEDMLDI